jgi:hypothetical protein
MNTSFRTAFWAMCLGLTVPMVLFVGVEMTSGGRAARSASGTASDHRGSLRSYWEHPRTKLAGNVAPPGPVRGKSGATTASPAPQDRKTRATVAQVQRKHRAPPEQAPETDDAKVTLGPHLEPDPGAAEPATARGHGVPALVTGQRPSVEILQEPGEPACDVGAIHERLDGIQQQLDRLGRTIDAQARREPPADAVRQTVELLRELRQARELEGPDSHGALSSPVATDATKPDAGQGDKNENGSKAENGGASGAVAGSNPAGAPKPKPRPLTRIYRPRYMSATALAALVEPLLTSRIGKAGAANAGADESSLAAGEDPSPAPRGVLVVRDFPEVLRRIDRLVHDLDIPPLQVVIEATVITLRLNGTRPHGIDLQEFNVAGPSSAVARKAGARADNSPAAPPGPGSLSAGPPSATGGSLLTHGLGLKCGVLRGNPRDLLSDLQAAAQIQCLNSWQLNVLDRQAAQLMLHDALSAERGVPQPAAGTILRICPIVTKKGRMRLDIQRCVDRDAATSGIRSAALTSQMILREGETAVLGGFFADHTETIVLLTPHVIRPTTEPAENLSRKAVPKSNLAARPILEETAGRRGATGMAPPPQNAASGPLRPASAGAPSTRSSSARSARPGSPRLLPRLEDIYLQPTGAADAAGEPTDDSPDRIPAPKLPPKPPLPPDIRPAGESPPP